MEKISVIVPVYKVEEFLDKCIESITQQTYKNLEIILIDDGSPDNSGAICDEWAKKDKRIKVIHSENSGVSSARNQGIDIATGKYIAFVDPDDLLDSTMYEKLLKTLKENNADISFCAYSKNEDDGKKITPMDEYNLKNATWETFPRYLITTDQWKEENGKIVTANVMGCIWRSLYTKESIGDVRFRKMAFCEDMAFQMDVMKKQPKLAFLDEFLYFYLIRQDSAVRSRTIDFLKARESFINTLDELYTGRVTEEEFNRYKFYCYRSGFIFVADSKSKEVKKYFLNSEIFQKLNTKQNYKAKQACTKDRKARWKNFLVRHNLFKLYSLWFGK